MRIFFSTVMLISSISAFAQSNSNRCFVYYDGPDKQFLIAKGSSFIWSKAMQQAYGNLPDAISALKNLQQQEICPAAADANSFDCTISHRTDGQSILRAKPIDESWLAEYVFYAEPESTKQIDELAAELQKAGQCIRIQDLGVEQMRAPYYRYCPKQC
jgi:HPt (histidine-containing phosphotransfer) domain-containing protein